MEQFLSAKYLSGRSANQKIGVVGSTEEQKVLEVIGNVGIGTTIFDPTQKLDVRGSVSVADTITATTVNATTVVVTGTGNTFADLTVTGLSTFSGNIDANGNLDVDGLSDLDELNVAGISTFGSDVDVNASVDISTSLTVGSATTITGAGIVAGIVTGTLDNDLTLATSGTGLSGSATYNNSGAATFTVTSNATDANTAGTIVARDGSGNFSAGIISANINIASGISSVATLDATNATIDNLTFTSGTAITSVDTDLSSVSVSDDTLASAKAIKDYIDGEVSTINTTIGNIDLNFAGDTGTGAIDLDNETFTIAGTANEIETVGAGNTLTIGLPNVVAITTSLTVGSATTINSSGINAPTGIITATSFVGNLIGDAPGLTNGIASTATQLENSRTFEITGDVVASPISFDGTGNVSLAATIQPNSVGLGTDTFGDYVKDISGTSQQIVVTGGTGEGSTPTLSLPTNLVVPQDLTVTRDLQVNRDLNVTGSITIGGTTAFINVPTLTVFDPDIVLGYRTDAFGNDISTDNTANHGGVALASTEGTPLVDLFIAGIETNPSTYKKIMWFKEGTFAGLGTDAWLINYAVGIGSTQFPTGTRLAAGNVQITENDISVVRNINASGIITGTLDNTLTLATSGTGLSGSATYDNSGAATFTVTSDATSANTAGTIVARDGSGNFSAGTITANLTGVASTATKLETARDFSVSGDVATASPISFNGTGNVDLAVTLSNNFNADTSGIITASRFVSDIATGTAPLTVSSTTLVSNLNADLLDGQEGSYYTNASNINAGTIGDAYLPATISSDITGNAATATTATNLTDAANITTGTISDDRLPDLITSNINISSGISTVSQLVVGSAVTITSSGINASSGIITALQFVGTASTASFATTAFTLNGTAEINLSVGTAVTATNIAGGDAGDIPYQSAANTTTFVDASSASTGQVLLWNGSTPSWGNVSSAAGAFGGISVQDESTPVGTAGSIVALNFVGSNIQATASTGANGISTITLSDTPTFDSLTVTGLTSTQNLNVVGVSTFSDDVFVGSGITMYASTGIISATAFYGSGGNLEEIITGKLDGIQVQEEGSDVGIGFTFSILNFVGPGVTATAGVGSTATITIPGFGQDADGNLFGGDGAGGSYDPATGDACFNTFLGCNAGNSITSGDHNNFLGRYAGFCNTTGCFNNFLGQCAGYGGTGGVTGSNNTAIGQEAGKSLTSGTNNNFLGRKAGYNNTSGTRNVFIGDCAGYCNTTGCYNTFFGRYAGSGGSGGVTGNHNTAIGQEAGKSLTSGTNNTFLGRYAGFCNTTGCYNTFLGNRVGYCNTTGCYNTFLGLCAGYGGTGGVTGSNNTAIGQDAGKCLTSGTYNNFFGRSAGYCNTSGSYNLYGGCQAGYSGNASTSCQNIFFGTQAGYANTTGCYNVAIGYQAGQCVDNFGDNVFIGCQAGCSAKSGSTGSLTSSNVFLGALSGATACNTNYSVLIGVQAGGCSCYSTKNVYIGYGAARDAWCSGCSIAIGQYAGYCNQGDDNIFLGRYAGPTFSASGPETGNRNVYLGYAAGCANANSGCCNVIIGQSVQPSIVNGSNQLEIGSGTNRWISGDSSFNIGIGTTAPTAKLHVVGGVNVSGVVTATDFNSTSDAKLKTNVQIIPDPLEKVLQINGVSFNWIKDNKPSMGVIADNIQEILPELVSDSDPKTVNYNGLIGLLIEVVKEQQTQINSLNERLSKLE